MTSEEFATRLLDGKRRLRLFRERHSVPAERDSLRISYAYSLEDLKDGIGACGAFYCTTSCREEKKNGKVKYRII